MTTGIVGNAMNLDTINNLYKTTFGREADVSGLNYWKSQLDSGKFTDASQLETAFKSGASGYDTVAMADKANYDTAWNKTLNPADSGLYYDAVKDTWAKPALEIPQMPVTTASQSSLSPARWNVEKEQVVEDRIQGLIEKNSPLMQQAETLAKQQMNERGLLNSSIGVQAGQAAVMDKAESIASKDARTFAESAKFNADTQNQFTQAQLERELKVNLAQMDANTRLALAGMEKDAQSTSSGRQLYAQSIKNISDIQRDDTLDAANKQAAIEDQVAMLKNGLTAFGGYSSLNLDSLLNFKPSTAAVGAEQDSALSVLTKEIADLRKQLDAQGGGGSGGQTGYAYDNSGGA